MFWFIIKLFEVTVFLLVATLLVGPKLLFQAFTEREVLLALVGLGAVWQIMTYFIHKALRHLQIGSSYWLHLLSLTTAFIVIAVYLSLLNNNMFGAVQPKYSLAIPISLSGKDNKKPKATFELCVPIEMRSPRMGIKYKTPYDSLSPEIKNKLYLVLGRRDLNSKNEPVNSIDVVVNFYEYKTHSLRYTYVFNDNSYTKPDAFSFLNGGAIRYANPYPHNNLIKKGRYLVEVIDRSIMSLDDTLKEGSFYYLIQPPRDGFGSLQFRVSPACG